VILRHPLDVDSQRDIWAEWLAERRSGGDAEVRCRMLEHLGPVRDRVLDRAALVRGETLLDVGCGEGLVGFGALERGAGHVVFSDVSGDLLSLCRESAAALGLLDRCSFVHAGADDLSGIDDASLDVVTTRSVLIYVARKDSAFSEFARVLRPGGRISLFEPINRFGMEERRNGFCGYPADGLGELAERVERVYAEIQPPDDPMVDFDERDLVRLAEEAGFFPIDLELRVEIRPTDAAPWDAFVNSSGNPKIPTLAEAMDQVLTAEEGERVTSYLRPLVEEGAGTWRMATAYLTATKP
jgi:ubiquinone/menaquinone biosynthesis C-methylase UbiE